MRRRRARLKPVSGGRRSTHSDNITNRKFDWDREAIARPFAAVASRKLRFNRINRLIGELPPSKVLDNGMRVYLFRTGEDRDDFVEAFYDEYSAKAYRLKDPDNATTQT